MGDGGLGRQRNLSEIGLSKYYPTAPLSQGLVCHLFVADGKSFTSEIHRIQP